MKALMVLSALAVVCCSTEIEESEVMRGDVTQCPPNAVCADIFDYNQTDPDTEVTTAKRRRIVNCFCPNSDNCPNLKRHTLHASPKHRQQICRHKNTLPRCKNGNVAEEMHLHAEEFEGKTFYRMVCRCFRHMNPQLTGGFSARATELLGAEDRGDHTVHNYVCIRTDADVRRRANRRRGRRRN